LDEGRGLLWMLGGVWKNESKLLLKLNVKKSATKGFEKI
jgi:hypothetical protein